MSDASRRAFLRFLLIAAFAAVVLPALTVACILLAGRSRWERTRAELLARGEKLSLRDFAPKPVPPDENFYGADIWTGKNRLPFDALKEHVKNETVARAAEIAPSLSSYDGKPSDDFRSNVADAMVKSDDTEQRRRLAEFLLENLRPAEPTLATISSLLDRPSALPPIDYSKNFSISTDYVPGVLSIAKTLRARAFANLVLGNSAAAARDATDLLRLSETLKNDPLMICLLVRMVPLKMADETIDLGLKFRAWDDSQLRAFDAALTRVDLVADAQRALRGERGGFNDFLEEIRSGSSKSISDLLVGPGFPRPRIESLFPVYFALFGRIDQAKYNERAQTRIDRLETARREGIHPADFQDAPATPASLLRGDILTTLASPAFENFIAKIAAAQDRLQMTRLACALDRYRLRHGNWPRTLDALAPEFLPEIPRDVLAGQTFHYHADDAGGFRLWSVGWDDTDDGGAPANPRHGATAGGDWVWGEERLK